MRLLIAILTLFSIRAATGQEPPKPRFDEPVDYVAWINQTFGGSIKDNAADRYHEAFAAYVAPGDRVFEQIAKRFGRLYSSEEDGPATSTAWIRANRKSLRLFEEATRIRDCYFERTSKSKMLVDTLCPQLAYFQRTQILLRVRAF